MLPEIEISEIDKQLMIGKLIIEIKRYKGETAQSLIQIGLRLIRLKEMVGFGNWGTWVEVNLAFSQNTAGQFMRIAREFSNSGSVKNFSTKELYLLLEIPKEEREEFIQQSHTLKSGESKTVYEMNTTGEFEFAVDTYKEKKAKEAQNNTQKQLPKVKEKQTGLHRSQKAQLTIKENKQKVKTDAKLLIRELTKNTKTLEHDYARVREFDQGTDKHIEDAAGACERIAQKLRLLINTTEKPSQG